MSENIFFVFDIGTLAGMFSVAESKKILENRVKNYYIFFFLTLLYLTKFLISATALCRVIRPLSASSANLESEQTPISPRLLFRESVVSSLISAAKTVAEMPISTDYSQSLRKIAKIFSFLRTTENSNFSTGIFLSSYQKCCQKSAK